MYTLRILPNVDTEPSALNYLLGYSYRTYFKNTPEFNRILSEHFPGGLQHLDKVKMFISGDIDSIGNSNGYHAVFEGYHYYIMVEGTTVESIYYRE